MFERGNFFSGEVIQQENKVKGMVLGLFAIASIALCSGSLATAAVVSNLVQPVTHREVDFGNHRITMGTDWHNECGKNVYVWANELDGLHPINTAFSAYLSICSESLRVYAWVSDFPWNLDLRLDLDK